MYSIVKAENAIGIHFKSKGHNHLHMKVIVIEKVFPNTPHYGLEVQQVPLVTIFLGKQFSEKRLVV